MKLKWVVAGVSLALFAAVGIPTSWAISGGEDAQDGAFPFAVLLSMPQIPEPDVTTRASACSGVLIAAEWVASAGHCFHDATAAKTRVSGAPRYAAIATIGRATISGQGGAAVEVVDVRQHPTVDFALLRLASPVTDVAPIKLNTQPPIVGETVRMTGWGTSNSSTALNQRPDRLQTGIWVVDGLTAGTVLMRGRAPATTTSACPFDSGAPYFTEGPGGPLLVATEIAGPACPHAGQETTARIDTMLAWIASQDPTLTP
jgi:hypothetical protein